MSDVEITAVDGAEVAPVTETQAPVQTTTTEQVETQEQQDERARDDRGRFVPQERVNEITRARRDAERNLASERQLREQLETQLAQYQRQPSQSQGDKPPSLGDFQYDTDAWAAAMTEYAVSRASSSAELRLREQATQQTQAQAVQKFEERSREYAAAHPDYDQAIADLGRVVRFSPEVIEAIATSEHGPAVAHHLATHLDDADRVARLPPHLAAVQLGRIEAQVSMPKPKPVTNAPNPAPTLGGGATLTRDPDKQSVEEWMKWRNSQ